MQGFVRSCRAVILLTTALAAIVGCGKKSTSSGSGGDTWDIDARGIPKFVATDYIDLSRIGSISRFRSSAGHDYTHDDHAEHCRSMKHYFWPQGGNPGQPHNPSWSTIPIYSPVDGTVTNIFDEFAGTQVWIAGRDYPAFEFRIFHVGFTNRPKQGDRVNAGQTLGKHAADETMSDIAVRVATPAGWRLVSYFDVMTDSLFQSYRNRGVETRARLIISKEERNADSLTCSGETFLTQGNLESWVVLR